MKFHLRSSSTLTNGDGNTMLRSKTGHGVSRRAMHYRCDSWMHPLHAMKTAQPSPPTDPAADDTENSVDTHNIRQKSKGALHLEEERREDISRANALSSCSRALQFFGLGRHHKNRHALMAEPVTTATSARIIAVAPSEEDEHAEEGSDDAATISVPKHAGDSLRRGISFTSVRVQEYNRILGDHPCCSSGLPLGLGWDVETKYSFDFEDYEKNRARHRGRKELRLGCEARKDILCSLTAPSTELAPSSSPTCETSSSCNLYSARDLRMTERRLNREREHAQYFRMHERRETFDQDSDEAVVEDYTRIQVQ